MEDASQAAQNYKSQELSLKEMILTIQDSLSYLWKKKLLIILFGVLGAVIGFTYAFFKKTQYVAELTFVLEENQSSALGSYMGLANQFGLDLGGGSSSGLFSGENVIEFLKSRLMVEKTLLSPTIANGKPQSLAEVYIHMKNLREQWSEAPALKSLQFSILPDRSKFNMQQDSILHVIYQSIIKNNLKVNKPDKKLSFISVECKAEDELFAKAFTERLVSEATSFYIQTKTKRSQNAVDKLQLKSDSLEALLNRKTYAVAASQDMNLNPARNIAGVQTELGSRDKMVLQTMYAEVVKNLELSRMSMAQETPIIQVVDTPILPLKKDRPGKLKCLIIGGILGGFLIVLWILTRRIYCNMMTNN